MSEDIVIGRGLPEPMREQAGAILEEAFGEKNRLAVRDPRRRQAFIRDAIDARHVIVAARGEQLLGLAGLSTRGGPYAGGLLRIGWDPRPHVAHLGWRGATWAAWGLQLAAHHPRADELYVDGIAVVPRARRAGIGTRLLDEVVVIAGEQGKPFVRLDVVDTNSRAQALYERLGYRVTGRQSSGYMRRWTGFTAIISMERAVDARPEA